jgi:hypothetical protein
MANTTVAVTPGSGASIGVYNDASSYSFQRVISALEPSQKTTYFASYKGQSIGTGATTNILTIAGSATKKVTVAAIFLSATAATAASYFDVLVNRQSAADTGGTAATTATIIKADTTNATATAVAPLFYTAGPTAGTVTGTMAAYKLFAPITGTPAPVTIVNVVPNMTHYGQGITLNGVADVLALTVNAVTPANATSWDVTVVWVEEA